MNMRARFALMATLHFLALCAYGRDWNRLAARCMRLRRCLMPTIKTFCIRCFEWFDVYLDEQMDEGICPGCEQEEWEKTWGAPAGAAAMESEK